MADNFEDGKDDKNNKGQKDIAYLAQFDNVVNDIKSQIRITNPAELARLNASITSLLSSNLPPETLAKLQNLQAFIREREEQAEQIIFSQQLEEERKAEADRLASLLEREVKEAAKLEQIHQETARLEEQHKEFTKDADEYLSAMKDENAKLDDVIKDGKIDSKKLEALVKTDDQIKKQQEEYKKLLKHRDEVHKHYEEVNAHNDGLLKERTRLGNDLAVKEKTEKPQSPTIVNIKELIKNQDKKIKAFEPVLAKATKQKSEVDKKKVELDVENKSHSKKVKTIAALLTKNEKNPDERKEDLRLLSLLKKQHNVIHPQSKDEDVVQHEQSLDESKRYKEDNKLSPEHTVDPSGSKSQEQTKKQTTTNSDRISKEEIVDIVSRLKKGFNNQKHSETRPLSNKHNNHNKGQGR
ncbi:MAG: hypothetical protein LN575_03965 [Rickettsia endosymbiont of Gnoriste bilineata]|nr:hypothetical protein [Rickettsia endosymbiont of Gnoriste bilineata]